MFLVIFRVPIPLSLDHYQTAESIGTNKEEPDLQVIFVPDKSKKICVEVLIVEKIYGKGFVIDYLRKIYNEDSLKIQLTKS